MLEEHGGADDMGNAKNLKGGEKYMRKKLIAIILAGAIVATAATVLAWDDSDSDAEYGDHGMAYAWVAITLNSQGYVQYHYHYGYGNADSGYYERGSQQDHHSLFGASTQYTAVIYPNGGGHYDEVLDAYAAVSI